MINYNYLMYIIILFIISFLYQKFQLNNKVQNEYKQYEIVKKYLLKDSSLAKSKLPILWVHIDKELNSRNWETFYSRSTKKLNQPYKLFTLQSIINKCGKDFNICIIDDSTFKNLIPGWITNLDLVADPVKTKLRELALAKLLFNYGGLLVPSSFLCFKNLSSLYDMSTKDDKIGVSEMINHSESAIDSVYALNNTFISCTKNNPTIEKYVQYLTQIVSNDYTAESIFKGATNNWFYNELRQNNNINIISAENIGTVDSYNEKITIERLANNTFINLPDNNYGLYIPDYDILNTLKYEWLARLSQEQLLESDTNLGKFILYSHS